MPEQNAKACLIAKQTRHKLPGWVVQMLSEVIECYIRGKQKMAVQESNETDLPESSVELNLLYETHRFSQAFHKRVDPWSLVYKETHFRGERGGSDFFSTQPCEFSARPA